jgi:hypothetical protein
MSCRLLSSHREVALMGDGAAPRRDASYLPGSHSNHPGLSRAGCLTRPDALPLPRHSCDSGRQAK